MNEKVKVKSLHTSPRVPSHLFNLHTLGAFIGNCGSGKTNAIALLTREYLDYGSFNRVYVISPTYSSNDVWQSLPEIQEEDVYTDVLDSQTAIHSILDKIKEDADIWQSSKEYVKIWKKWLRVEEDDQRMTQDEMNALILCDFTKPIEVEKPSSVLIIDDMSHSNLFQNSPKNPFINLCLRHRHIHGVGLSIFICVQNYRTGIPKCLRQNIKQFFIFPTKDNTQTDAIYEEIGNIVDLDTFYHYYHQATNSSDHDFLTIDTNPQAKSSKLKKLLRFRKNFDEYLVTTEQIVNGLT